MSKSLWKKHLTYFRLHLSYFVFLAMAGTLILWWIGGTHSTRLTFIDCLFNITSALCITGLISVRVDTIPQGGQVILMFMMILGGQVATSVVPLFVKRRRYCQVAKIVMEKESQGEAGTSLQHLGASTTDPNSSYSLQESASSSPQQVPEVVKERKGPKGSSLALLRRLSNSFQQRSKEEAWMREMASKKHAEHIQEIFQEHRATTLLTWIVPSYYVGVQLLGFFIAWGCILNDKSATRVLASRNVNAGFFALFATISAFANAGLVLVNENMTLFKSSSALLLTLAALVLLGNTMFAPALRGIILLLRRYDDHSRRDVYEFLLNNPRKCYTHLFPRTTTIWLVITITAFNSFECSMFYILDWSSRALKGFTAGEKLVNGIFQTVNIRAAGMNSVNLADLSPSMLFLYCGMMYIAVYPVFLSRQYSRHHAAKLELLGIPSALGYDRDIHDTTIATQSRRLLAQDSAYLFLSTFFICVSENKQLRADPRNFSTFSVIFEVISAYGNVGLSLGYNCSVRIDNKPCEDVPYSFSGKWGVVGKLFIIVVMFLGRHRGLPDSIDSAILLPEERFYMMVKRQTLEAKIQYAQPPSRSECSEHLPS